MNASLAATQNDKRIPVYLLTGYLGSGKTSLLKSWLGQPEFQDAALIINELGEIGLDNQLLSGASESALVANACICCTGLPGLSEALEDLFWARLERRIHKFPSLVIETTGLAEPGPVAEALTSSDLLKERYRLAGVITCLSAATADAVLTHHAEARAQLTGADLLVITKTDLLGTALLEPLHQRLAHQLAHSAAQAQMRCSSHASLTAAQVLDALQNHKPLETHDPSHAHAHAHADHHDHAHSHSAEAFFWAIPQALESDRLGQQIAQLQSELGTQLLRLKGRVLTIQGRDVVPCVVQMAPFEAAPAFQADTLGTESTLGLTVIVALPLSERQRTALKLRVA
jgi:G3E family GTPase